MVNEEKIRIMTKLTSMENDDSNREIKDGGYYKSDYIRLRLIRTIGSYSIAYVLMIALVALYHFDYLVSGMVIQDLRNMIIAVVALYLLLVLLCTFFTVTIYSKKYSQVQKKQREYYKEIKKLEAFYDQSKEGGNG